MKVRVCLFSCSLVCNLWPFNLWTQKQENLICHQNTLYHGLWVYCQMTLHPKSCVDLRPSLNDECSHFIYCHSRSKKSQPSDVLQNMAMKYWVCRKDRRLEIKLQRKKYQGHIILKDQQADISRKNEFLLHNYGYPSCQMHWL